MSGATTADCEWAVSSEHGPLVWADVGPSWAPSTMVLLGTPAGAGSSDPGTKGSCAGVSASRVNLRDRRGTVTGEGGATCVSARGVHAASGLAWSSSGLPRVRGGRGAQFQPRRGRACGRRGAPRAAHACAPVPQAIKNNAGFRVWVLFFLVMCSFSLLFLDWYDS